MGKEEVARFSTEAQASTDWGGDPTGGLPPLARHDHIDLPAVAFGANQALAPIEHGRFVPRSHLGRPGFSSTISGLADRRCLLFRDCWWCRRA
jgi:hypothetical protein